MIKFFPIWRCGTLPLLSRYRIRSSKPWQSRSYTETRKASDTYACVPTSLYHYSPRRSADLVDTKANDGSLDEYLEYHVTLKNGLVHQNVSNGLRMRTSYCIFAER